MSWTLADMVEISNQLAALGALVGASDAAERAPADRQGAHRAIGGSPQRQIRATASEYLDT